ncbi:MAG: hypothetical protein ACAI18_02615 [Gemmatimonadales bacterium]
MTVEVTVGRCLYFGRRFEEAIGVLRRHLERSPDSIQGYVTLYRSLRMRGMPREALLALERGINVIGRVPLLLACAGNIHGQLGQRDQALALLDELRLLATRRHVPSAYQAEILFGMGELDETFRVWDLAVKERSGWIPFVRCDPAWDQLRSDPRYVALERLSGVED